MNGLFKVYPAGVYSLLAVALFIIILIVLIPLLILGIAGAAFSRLGFTWIEAVGVILLMIVGSFVNIPLSTVRRALQSPREGEPEVFDAFSGEPVVRKEDLVPVLLNLGGAVIPAGVCIYLLYETGQIEPGSIAIPLGICLVVVAIVTFTTTKILPAWGIRAPLFLPALSALACGFLLNGGTTGLSAGVTAFAGGTIGTIAGATACGYVKGLRTGIPSISIGGSGMFGPVILCAILAALAA